MGVNCPPGAAVAGVRCASPRRVERHARLWPLPLLLLLFLVLHACIVALVSADASSSSSSSTGSSSVGDDDWPVVRVGFYDCLYPTVEGGCWRDDPAKLVDMWLAHLAQKPLLGRVRVEIVRAFLPAQPSYNESDLVRITHEAFFSGAAESPPPNFMILPIGNSVWTDHVGPLLESRHIVTLAISPLSTQYVCSPTDWQEQTNCAGPNTRRFRYVNSILNSGRAYYSSFISLMRVSHVRRLGVIENNSPFYVEVLAGVLLDAEQYGMDVTFLRREVPLEGPAGSFGPSLKAVNEIMGSLVAMDEDEAPEALIIISFDCVPWIQAMRRYNYFPKALAALRCVDTQHAADVLGDDLRFVTSPGVWHESLASSDFEENADLQPWSLYPTVVKGVRTGVPSAEQFAQHYRRVYNYSSAETPSYADAAFLACLMGLEAAITLANSTEGPRVQESMDLLFQPSFYGRIAFNRFGFNEQKEFIVLQRDVNNALQVIDPVVSASAGFIFPAPSWDERVYDGRFMSSTVERIFLALLLACIVCTLLLLLYFFRHRNLQVLAAAGLPFYVLMGLGCITSFVALLTWTVDNTTAACDARIWLWTISFYLLVAPILANSYRIARIAALAEQAIAKSTRFSTESTLTLTAAIMAPQLLINIIWSAAGGLHPELVTPDPLRPAHSYTDCVLSTAHHSIGEGCLITTLVLVFFCLLVACVLAFRIRNVSGLFSDARPIGLAMYLFSVLAVVVLAVHVALPSETRQDQMVRFAVRSGAVLLAYQTAIALLFLRRFLHKNQSVTSVTFTTTTQGNTQAGAFPARGAAAAAAGVLDGAGKAGRKKRSPGRQKLNLPLIPPSYRAPWTSAGQEAVALAVLQRSQAAVLTSTLAATHAPTPVTGAGGPSALVSTGSSASPFLPVQPDEPDAAVRAAAIAAGGECDADEWSATPSSALRGLSTPRFHLPPRSEYEHWPAPQLVALLDEAASTIAGLHALLDAERERQETAQRRRMHKQRLGLPLSSPIVTLLPTPTGVTAVPPPGTTPASSPPLVFPLPPQSHGAPVHPDPRGSPVSSGEEHNPLSQLDDIEDDDDEGDEDRAEGGEAAEEVEEDDAELQENQVEAVAHIAPAGNHELRRHKY